MPLIPSEQELRDLLKEGKTLYQISRHFNTKIPEIFELCKDYSILYLHRIPKPTKQDLESMYHDEHLTQKQIGKEFGVQQLAVGTWSRKYKIQIITPMPPKEVLERMYIDEGMSQKQIASKFNVTQQTISRRLRNYNISTTFPIPTKDDLLNYIGEGLNQHQIAEKCKVSDWKIFDCCEHYGISGMVNGYRCTTQEHQEWRHAVLERDHRTCQMCGETDAIMQAHHIVPYCDHPEVAYELENGITLCKQCHMSIRGHEYEYIEQFAAITQQSQSIKYT